MTMDFLPISREDMKQRGWEQCDFVYISGDAYVDHPSFGPAIISRLLEAHGYKVGIIAQPDWKNPESVQILGKPRLGFLVSAGNMDSMVNHYTVSKKRRAQDSYTPGGVMGKRPDYATIVYCNLLRSVYKDSPIIIGGIEASLRRLAHYDYWSNKLKRSILLDSQADIISYGMGEHSIIEIADALDSGIDIKDITFIDGTVYRTKNLDSVYDYKLLPDFTELQKDKKEYAKSFFVQYSNTDPFSGKRLVEPYEGHVYVVQNPPAKPLSQEEMDDVYDLPYMRTYIQARSHESLIKEAELLTEEPDFKGYIHDVGGPTANFRYPACAKQMTKGACPNKQCLFPEPCKNLRADHSDYIQLLRKLRAIPKVKKVFIRSGIRFDYLLADSNRNFLRELCEYHVSGQLKVAPEHVADSVLRLMGKPKNSVYRQFVKEYNAMNEKLGKKQYLVPYLMSSHPGSDMKAAVELAEHLRDLGYMPEQVQDFYPTPSTISTCMYYTGYDCRTMEKVYVPTNPHEKAMQRALIQYRNPKNYDLVVEALKIAGRTDLIGYDKKCLVRPRGGNGGNAYGQKAESVFHESRGSQGRSQKPSKEKPTKTIRNLHKRKTK